MSKRLQVLLDEIEYQELQNLAAEHGVTVAEWVRAALRQAKRSVSEPPVGRKLDVLDQATRYSLPTADIDQMIGEIERGYDSVPIVARLS